VAGTFGSEERRFPPFEQHMRRKRVVFIDTSPRTMYGGAQVFLGRVLPGLEEAGWDVTFVGEGRPEAPFVTDLRRLGISVETDVWPYPSLVEDAAQSLARWVNGVNRESVVVISVSSGIGWAALPLLEPSNATMCIIHSDAETFYAPLRHYGRFMTTSVGVSNEIARKIVEEQGMRPESVRTIQYGVPGSSRDALEITLASSRSRRSLEAIYVGRLAQVHKRIMDVVSIVDASSKLDARFRLIGDGPQGEAVRNALSDSLRDSRVVLEGWLSSEAVERRLGEADALVLTSDLEGLPIAVLEALAHGVVPVVSDIPCCRELIRDGQNGFLVPVGDIGCFVARLRELAQDRDRLARMRRQAWETGQSYSISRMVERYDSCLHETIERNARLRDDGRPVLNYPLMASCRSRYPTWVRRLKARSMRLVRRG